MFKRRYQHNGVRFELKVTLSEDEWYITCDGGGLHTFVFCYEDSKLPDAVQDCYDKMIEKIDVIPDMVCLIDAKLEERADG